jgi:hypothetical protein
MQKWTLKQIGPNVFEICFWDVGNETQWMLLRSDVHHDNPKCDQDLERKHLNEALESNCPVLDNGDLYCAMQGKYDRRSSKESIRPEHQTNNYLDSLVSTSVEFYQPYKSILAICGRGNHETAIQKNHETDLTDRLTAGLRSVGGVTLSSGYSGWVRLSVKSSANPDRYVASAWLHHYHGSGGGGPVTKGVIQTNRIAIIHQTLTWCSLVTLTTIGSLASLASVSAKTGGFTAMSNCTSGALATRMPGAMAREGGK